MLFLIGIRDLGNISGSIFGAIPLIPQQLFLNILMIDFGFLSNCECIYRFFRLCTH